MYSYRVLRSARDAKLLVSYLVDTASPHRHRSSPYETSIYLPTMFRGCAELGKRIRASSRVAIALTHSIASEETVIWLGTGRRILPPQLLAMWRFVWSSGAGILRKGSHYEDTISREVAPCMCSAGSEVVLSSARW